MPWSIKQINENHYVFLNKNQGTAITHFTLRRHELCDHLLHIQTDKTGKKRVEQFFTQISKVENTLFILNAPESPYHAQGFIQRKWQIECALLAINEFSEFSTQETTIFQERFGLNNVHANLAKSVMQIKLDRDGGSFELFNSGTMEQRQIFIYKNMFSQALFSKHQQIQPIQATYTLNELKNYVHLLVERSDIIEKIGEEYIPIHNRLCKELHLKYNILSFDNLKNKLALIRENISALQALFDIPIENILGKISHNYDYLNIAFMAKYQTRLLIMQYNGLAFAEHKSESFTGFFSELELLNTDLIRLCQLITNIRNKESVIEDQIESLTHSFR